MRLLTVVLILQFCASWAAADQPAPPREMIFSSANGNHLLLVLPAVWERGKVVTHVRYVMYSGDAEGPRYMQWTCATDRVWPPMDVLITDDGNRIITYIDPCTFETEGVVQVLGSEGKLIKAYKLAPLLFPGTMTPQAYGPTSHMDWGGRHHFDAQQKHLILQVIQGGTREAPIYADRRIILETGELTVQ